MRVQNFIRPVNRLLNTFLSMALLFGIPIAMASEVGQANAKQSNEQLLDKAFETYKRAQQSSERTTRLAHFSHAETLFETLAQQVQSADLYSNMGTAALQAEHLGQAILGYRRALLLNPSHRQAQQNLNHARSLLPNWVSQPKQKDILADFFFWKNQFPDKLKVGIAAWCFLIMSLSLAIAIRWRFGIFRSLAILPGILWLLLVGSVSLNKLQPEIVEGVISSDESIARAADSINAPPRFARPLPAGTEVTVLEQRDHWTRIVFADGQDAWIKSSHIIII